jgi:hypothetical protein
MWLLILKIGLLSPRVEDPADIIDFDEALCGRLTIQETASNGFDLDGYNLVFDVTQGILVDAFTKFSEITRLSILKLSILSIFS